MPKSASLSRRHFVALAAPAAIIATSPTLSKAIAASKGENSARVRSTRFAISAERPEGRGLTGTAFRMAWAAPATANSAASATNADTANLVPQAVRIIVVS